MKVSRLLRVLVFAAVSALVVAGVAVAQPAKSHKQLVQHLTLVVKSDEQHGKKGSDGKWHDAFLPASFSVKAGAKVVVTVRNFDDMAHSMHSQKLGLNQIILPGNDAGKVTKFTFVAPKKTGKYLWKCDPKCDPWAMKHLGFMRGYITVTA